MSVTLEEFVNTTLCQITKGVNEAQKTLDSNSNEISGAKINPRPPYNYSDSESNQLVEFDIAVTCESSDQKNMQIKIANVIRLGAGKNKTESENSHTRIKFKVPINYGYHKSDKEEGPPQQDYAINDGFQG